MKISRIDQCIVLGVVFCLGCDVPVAQETMTTKIESEGLPSRQGQFHVTIDAYVRANSPSEAAEIVAKRLTDHSQSISPEAPVQK